MLSDDKMILQTLNLKNFATFENQSISFTTGFNAIVGETGSGKSLILDAIELITGQRADKKLIRKGHDFASIEAIFDTKNPEITAYFDEIGHPVEDSIVIKRIIYKTGSSKSFINHDSCSQSRLQDVGKRFVDLVGQFENQKLFSPKYQLRLLDLFSNNQLLLEKLSSSFQSLQEAKLEYQELKNRAENSKVEADYLEFQLNELDQAELSLDEEHDLKESKEKITNKVALSQNAQELDSLFNGSDTGNGLWGLVQVLEKKILILGPSDHFIERVELLKDTLSELEASFQNDEDLHDLEAQYAQVLDRLDTYRKIQRKYNKTTEELILFHQDLLNRKGGLENIEAELKKSKTKMEMKLEETYALAHQLHQSRVKNKDKLSQSLTNTIHKLKMEGATVSIEIEETELSSDGISKVNFTAQTNKGEGFFSIKAIASGGELSRILLAVRQVISSRDSVSIFLFDEIDSGMGGQTALHIGKTLAQVSKNSQVIAVTHLPQIAQYASNMIVVDKETKNGRTTSKAFQVNQKEIGREISKMQSLSLK